MKWRNLTDCEKIRYGVSVIIKSADGDEVFFGYCRKITDESGTWMREKIMCDVKIDEKHLCKFKWLDERDGE